MSFRLPRPSTTPEKKNMRLSVVTITLNAARDLPLTIESITAQDFKDFEYVVVDGHSWDGSHDIFHRYAKEIDRVVEIEDSGVYAAMNFAVTQCRGDYIIFMNAGDVFYSAEALSNVFRQLDGESPDIIHGDHVYVDKSLELHRKSGDFAITRALLAKGDLSGKWMERFPCHQATLTKRELLTRMGGYDTQLEICADHDFLLRAYDAGASMKYIDETIAHYFGGGVSAQRSERCQLEWIKTYRSRSLFPQKVDRFLGALHFVRFDSQSPATGAKLSGFFPLQGPLPEAGIDTTCAWCAGEGFSIATPRHGDSVGLSLTGRNELEGQRLTIVCKGQTLGEVEIPVGEFEVDIPFAEPLAAKSVVDVFPSRADFLPNDIAFVSIMLMAFHFDPMAAIEVAPLRLGQEYSFTLTNAKAVAPLLRGGWSPFEPLAIWSIGERSHMIVAMADAAEELVMVLSGNPFVTEEARRVTILINGAAVATDLSLSTNPAEYVASLSGSGWRSPGTNFITFIPGETASGPGDPRALGINLTSIMLR
jgi:GT2 family glycosyltransferase